MIDERALIARLEAADPDTLVQLMRQPSAEEERAYRAYLGDERYQRMHGLALQQGLVRSAAAPRGNVVVIHGIMGGELTAFRGERDRGDHIWARIVRLALGRLGVLRLDESGRNEFHRGYQVRATGIMKRFYGELVLSLARGWRVEAFWFDWRKDLNLAAAELEASMNRWFGPTEPVHIVAHSMGGLVARTFIRNHPERWSRMWDAEQEGRRGGRLVMLGTPNHGSFAVPQILTGLEGMVRKLGMLDLQHSGADLLRIVNSFPGSYQMLPSPLAYPAGAERERVEALFRADTYRGIPVSQRHLDDALRFHAQLHELHLRMQAAKRDRRSELEELRRMVYVAGYNQPTLAAVDPGRVAARDGYATTLEGDGRVPHRLGALDGVPMYYIEEGHGELSTNRQIMDSLGDLLERGATDALLDRKPRVRAAVDEAAIRRRMEESEEEERMLLEMYLRQTRGTRRVPAAAAAAAATDEPAPGVEVLPEGVVPAMFVSPGERMAEELLTRGFLSSREGAPARTHRPEVPFRAPHVEVRLRAGGIQDEEYLDDGDLPVDAIAVGHYQGVKPLFADLALDRAISAALAGSGRPLGDGDLLLTQLSERGTLRGTLGQPFFLPDPRASGGAVGRVIAVAGMGVPGRFGVPELTVLARELVWALGRLHKRHLASVLIGSGNGNLPADEAVSCWLRGIKHALTGAADADASRVRRLTLVDHNPRRVLEIDRALRQAIPPLAAARRMTIDYTPLTPEECRSLDALAAEREIGRLQRRAREIETRGTLGERPDGGATPFEPARLTIGLEGSTYRFGAITSIASIPEREVPLDPELVREANDELVAQWNRDRQREHGEFLEKLLIPHDLRGVLTTDAPLVLHLDATTARIHWEMIAQPDVTFRRGEDGAPRADDAGVFLGTHRGLTRQLRTTFAPPPEPPPPARRLLRVLVVADPAEDARLPGAEEEGMAVADLFESFNDLYRETSENRVEVVRLFGPREATRTNVLRHLTLRSYDVLHFAGHCVFRPGDPAGSGWVFSRGHIVSARELDRIDRVPGFVFSNACESGITPDRSEMRAAALAPSFAEAFFRRGVVNFVCTAWPVDDLAARSFALELYRHLLGIRYTSEGGIVRFQRDGIDPQPMYLAMQHARRALAATPAGIRTWGAYQHYGSPTFRFFAEPAHPPTEEADGAADPAAEDAHLVAVPPPVAAAVGGGGRPGAGKGSGSRREGRRGG